MTKRLFSAARLLFTLATPTLAAACSGIAEPLDVVQLQGVLSPADGAAEPIAGSVAMVIGELRTQIGIGVEGATDGSSLGWRVRNGSCTGTGERIGPASAFPPIEIDDDGTGEAETVLFRRVATGAPYAAEVVREPDGAGSVLACAELIAAAD